jgi:hypothetical protein
MSEPLSPAVIEQAHIISAMSRDLASARKACRESHDLLDDALAALLAGEDPKIVSSFIMRAVSRLAVAKQPGEHG